MNAQVINLRGNFNNVVATKETKEAKARRKFENQVNLNLTLQAIGEMW